MSEPSSRPFPIFWGMDSEPETQHAVGDEQASPTIWGSGTSAGKACGVQLSPPLWLVATTLTSFSAPLEHALAPSTPCVLRSHVAAICDSVREMLRITGAMAMDASDGPGEAVAIPGIVAGHGVGFSMATDPVRTQWVAFAQASSESTPWIAKPLGTLPALQVSPPSLVRAATPVGLSVLLVESVSPTTLQRRGEVQASATMESPVRIGWSLNLLPAPLTTRKVASTGPVPDPPDKATRPSQAPSAGQVSAWSLPTPRCKSLYRCDLRASILRHEDSLSPERARRCRGTPGEVGEEG